MSFAAARIRRTAHMGCARAGTKGRKEERKNGRTEERKNGRTEKKKRQPAETRFLPTATRLRKGEPQSLPAAFRRLLSSEIELEPDSASAEQYSGTISLIFARTG